MSDGFLKLTPSIACKLFMCVTMFSLAKGMSVLLLVLLKNYINAITRNSYLFGDFNTQMPIIITIGNYFNVCLNC